MITEDLMKEQIKLEEEMREATISRFHAQYSKAVENGKFTESATGRAVSALMIDQFISDINDYTAEQADKPRRRPRAHLMLTQFGDNKTAAYLFIRHLLGNIMLYERTRVRKHRANRSTVLLAATEAIHTELRLRYFQKNRMSLMKAILKDHNKRDLPTYRRRELMRREFNKQAIEWRAEGWAQRERLQLGLTLLNILNKSAGIVEEYHVYENKKTYTCLTISDEWQEAMEKWMEKHENISTYFFPTVIPPRRWAADALVGGGYYTNNVSPYRLVKRAPMKLISEMENRGMGKITDAINAIQETPWRVNKEIVEAVQFAFDQKLVATGLPLSDPEELPPRPHDYKTGNVEADNAYKHECFKVHERNRRAFSKRLAVLKTISMGQKFSAYDAIYFPHDLDSRGRAYPKVPFLNPQGPDYAKAMLEFGRGKPIGGDEGEAYLAIAIANAWGQDKLSLQGRADWVYDNQDMLLSVAADWRHDQRWAHADEPFMALRGALEWAGLCREGHAFVSHMPVHFDATCSGLQHFSALLRDAEGGFHVNLTPNPDRQDIYGAVAAKATKASEALVDDPKYGAMARLALEIGITRSLCKRPVMIVPYSGTFKAAMDYIEDHYRDLDISIPLTDKEFLHDFVPFVTARVWDAINSTVIAARDAMTWITKACREVCKADKETPIQWETPDGFVCRQAVWNMKPFSVETFLDGTGRVQVQLFKEEAILHVKDMAQSLSPNYIHSMDACHLRKSILRGMDIGITDFAMIHDSFGVHASDMPRFVNECIKEAFIDMYQDGASLEKFREGLLTNVDIELPEMPPMGTLDLEGVRGSEFFFS